MWKYWLSTRKVSQRNLEGIKIKNSKVIAREKQREIKMSEIKKNTDFKIS